MKIRKLLREIEETRSYLEGLRALWGCSGGTPLVAGAYAVVAPTTDTAVLAANRERRVILPQPEASVPGTVSSKHAA